MMKIIRSAPLCRFAKQRTDPMIPLSRFYGIVKKRIIYRPMIANMKCKYILSIITAFCVGYGSAVCILSRGNAKKANNVKEYIFLGNDTVIYEEIDHSIYASGVDPYGVYNRENGIVPSEKTATEIVKAVLIPIYGSKISSQVPFRVSLWNKRYWCVRGSLKKGWEGGTFQILIDKVDGKICSISHGK